MTREGEINKIARRYAQDELKDNHASVEDIVAAAFLNGIDYAENHPRWISVKDELPPKEDPSCSLSINVLATDGNFIHKDFYDYNLKKWYRVNDWGYDDITHWMRIEPPAKLSNVERNGKNWKEKKGGVQ